MTYPHASLTDKQIRETYFVVPEFKGLYALALGKKGYRTFKARRQNLRASGGDLLLIGWPDGTTIAYCARSIASPIDLDTLVETYRASAAMYRIRHSEKPA